MSRVGKKPIELPKGVEVKIQGSQIEVKGAKGTLKRTLHPSVEVGVVDGTIQVNAADDSRQSQAIRGLTRTLINNMVVGVSQGYSRVLEINGVGYRADVRGNTLNLSLGYSHPIEFKLPKGINAAVDKQNRITLTGIDKELLGQTAAQIRAFRRAEPYKGKGIKYAEETIRRKVGKAGAK
ncbi:MAG: 50S ribosomal protein L6 [Deltaproteobacteria bacterium]|nr:50S ribosomal protein L6 [Deltaproteobacteria bacterium]MBW2070333.1 50S ribosomal protein L6 [Deltaproteobacteria bacterium]